MSCQPEGLVLCVVMAAVVGGGPALAQTNQGTAVGEIVVTAEKRASTVQKTPLSITAVTGGDLQNRGLTSAQDLAQAVPGVAVSSAGPGQARYEIRGLSSLAGESPTIGFYLDETPITPPASATTGMSEIDPDLFDLQRIEVLRGPQGTLYGAGSIGGTVKLVTNPPRLGTFSASAESSLSGTSGGGLNYAEKAMINLPVVSDKIALRVVGDYTHNSGWIDRIVVPDFPLETDGGLVRGNVLGLPASVIHHGDNGDTISGLRAALLISPTSRLNLTPSIFYQRISQNGMNTFDSVPGTAHYQPFDIAEPFRDRFTIYSLNASYDFGPVSLSSATAYWTRRSSQIQDASEQVQDALGLPGFAIAAGGVGPAPAFETDTTDQFSQEVRLASNGKGPFQWILGGFFSRYHYLFDGGSTIPGLATAAGGQFGTANLFHVVSPLTIKQEAVFVHASYDFGAGVKIEAGLRDFAYQSHVSSVATGFAYGGETPVVNSASASASGLNPMANISWSPTSDQMFYATAAKGFREGAGNFPIETSGQIGSACLANLQALGLTSAPLIYNPDTVWSYEIGEKARLFDRRVTLNSDVFYIRWSKVQQPVSLACGLTFTSNGPDAEVKGGEAEIQAEISDNLSLTQSVGYADAAFVQAYLPANVGKGQSLFDAPRWTLSSELRFHHPWGRFTFVAIAQNSFNSSSTDLTYKINTLPAKDITNLRVGVDADKWSVYIFANNVLNKHYALENLSLLTFTGPSYNRTSTNQPLTIGMDIETRF